MVIGLLALAAIPTTVGTCQAYSAHTSATLDSKRSQYFTLSVYCAAPHPSRPHIHGKGIVLRNNKLYVSTSAAENTANPATGPDGHPFHGFYINHPDGGKSMGLVSMCSSAPPAMGWIYVDRETAEVKYGNRTASGPHVVGEWGWTEDEVGLTLEGKEGFVVVEEGEGVWAVYFDAGGDWERLPEGRKVLEVSLERVIREKRDKEVHGMS